MSAAAMAGGAEKIVQQISKAVAHHGIVAPAYKVFYLGLKAGGEK